MKRNPRSCWGISAYRVGLAVLLLVAGLPVAGAQSSFIGPLGLGPSFSTVPAIGDVNPYGITVVPVTTGNLVQGDILISNFNNSANLQGTGTTIMEISPGGAVQTFAQIDASSLPGSCPGGVGQPACKATNAVVRFILWTTAPIHSTCFSKPAEACRGSRTRSRPPPFENREG